MQQDDKHARLTLAEYLAAMRMPECDRPLYCESKPKKLEKETNAKVQMPQSS